MPSSPAAFGCRQNTFQPCSRQSSSERAIARESRFYVFFPCIFYDYGIIIAVWQPTTSTSIDDKVLRISSLCRRFFPRCVVMLNAVYWINAEMWMFRSPTHCFNNRNISRRYEIWDTKWQCHYNVMEIYSPCERYRFLRYIHTIFYCRHYIMLKSGKIKEKFNKLSLPENANIYHFSPLSLFFFASLFFRLLDVDTRWKRRK